MIDPLTRDPVKTLGNIDSLDPNGLRSPRLRFHANSRIAKPILGHLITMAPHVKEHLLIHEAWLEEGHSTGAVGHITEVIDGLESYQRYPAARLVIHYLDFEVPALRICKGRHSQQQRDYPDHLIAPIHGAILGNYISLLKFQLHPSIHPSTNPLIHSSTHPFIHSSTHPFIRRCPTHPILLPKSGRLLPSPGG